MALKKLRTGDIFTLVHIILKFKAQKLKCILCKTMRGFGYFSWDIFNKNLNKKAKIMKTTSLHDDTV